MWKTAFKEFAGVWSALGRPYPFMFFKGCLPQILIAPFLNTLPKYLLILVITSVIFFYLFQPNVPFLYFLKTENLHFLTFLRNVERDHLRQSIQDWTKWNLWKTVLKKFHLVHSWILCPIWTLARNCWRNGQ